MYSLKVELIFLSVGHIFHKPMRNTAAAVYASVPCIRYGSLVITHDPVMKPVNNMTKDAMPNATLVRDTFSGTLFAAHIFLWPRYVYSGHRGIGMTLFRRRSHRTNECSCRHASIAAPVSLMSKRQPQIYLLGIWYIIVHLKHGKSSI